MSTDPDIARIAQFLAAHSMLLLGLGIVVVILAATAVAGTVRFGARHQEVLRSGLVVLTRRAQHSPVLRSISTRTSALLRHGYLTLHLVLGLTALAAITMFVAIGDEIGAGEELAAFDLAFAQALQDTTTPAWQRFFVTISWLGTREALTVATLVVAMVLALQRRFALAVVWMAAQAGGGLLNLLLKNVVERARPEYADAVSGWSFPSGHAMGTFIFCGVGAYLLLRQLRSWTRVYVVVTAAVIWCVIMSFSRLYLGEHFASDAIAGLIAGAAWVAVSVTAIDAVLRRHGGRTGAANAPHA